MTERVPQFENTENYKWSDQEKLMIAQLRDVYNGHCEDYVVRDVINEVRKEFHRTMGWYQENIDFTGDPDIERKQLDYILRFAAMLAAGGFSSDAASLLKKLLDNNLARRERLVMPVGEFSSKMRNAIAKHSENIIPQATRDLAKHPASMDKKKNYSPPELDIY